MGEHQECASEQVVQSGIGPIATMNDNGSGSNGRTAKHVCVRASTPRHSTPVMLDLPSAAFCLGPFPMTGIYRWNYGRNMKDARLMASSH
jgi:hypothetical protein